MASNTGTGSPLQEILSHHRRHRSWSFDRDTPFSWPRCVVFLVSYTLVLSDVFRSGLGIRNISNYTALEPNVGLFLGPSGYTVAHIYSNASYQQTMRIWPYKFDSTSVTIRAVAQFLNVKSWWSCVVYKESCADTRINLPTVFAMLDSIVESMSQYNLRHSELPNVTLRTENAYFDRLHDYLLPFFFTKRKRRTIQALYYNASIFDSGAFNFCTSLRNQPYACNDFWVNFEATCSSINQPCVQRRTIWSDIKERSRLLAQTYAGMQLDMLLLEGYEDRGIASISFQGRQQYDITLIVRIRNCSFQSFDGQTPLLLFGECSTIAVHDHRYESGSITSDVVGWYNIIATIRILGQVYAWLRLAMLFIGCYCARSTEPMLKKSNRIDLILGTFRTMFTAPSQVVTYGSVVPVALYSIAQLLDSMMVYEGVRAQFTSLNGVFHINLRQFIQVATVSMRSLWLLSLLLHVVLLVRTRCCWSSTSKGIPGIPEFFISAVAFLTSSAQYRSLSFRDTHLVHVMEIEPSRHMRALRASTYNNSHGFWFLFALGDNLDFKCLCAFMLIVLGCLVVLWGLVHAFGHLGLIQKCDFFLWPHTIVPFAAGTLWPVSALMVSWNGFVFTPVNLRRDPSQRSVSAAPDLKPSGSMVKLDASRVGKLKATAFIINQTEDSQIIQNAVAFLDGRSREVHATLCLMNLTIMTDPIVFCRLRWFGGHEIGIYRSTRFPKQLYLLPMATAESTQSLQIDCSAMELLATVNSMDLPWMDLLHCG